MMAMQRSVSNADIADRLASIAQLLAAARENPFKVKAYRRAADRVRALSESLQELVQQDSDLTQYAGIGEGIAGAIREIVATGSLRKLEQLRLAAPAEINDLSAYPRLDPKRVLRVYKKLGISSVGALRERLASGEIERILGLRLAQHVQQGLTESHAMLLYRADTLRLAVEEFLLGPCGVKRAEAAGDYRRRVEVIEELSFLVETSDFLAVVARLQQYGGHMPVLKKGKGWALFAMSSGILLRVRNATSEEWGLVLLNATGTEGHLKQLGPCQSKPSESEVYRSLGLPYIEPELREGRDEVEKARQGSLPALVTVADIKGELHAHSTSSDGANSIQEMAVAARAKGYEYIGITDHSQSLKIARGVSVEDLWQQIRFIEKLNGRLKGIRILKSAEVDILADGSLDYPDDLLAELDYTVCSIHSRFNLTKKEQTERILRAMDNRYFNILGHATGRRLLTRPGYEIDVARTIRHAKECGCFFEINSSPERLDLSAENARAAAGQGLKIAVSTDAHSTRELEYARCGIDQGRRAGLTKTDLLNALPWNELRPLFRR
jgi:DNA polymerase (family 10)